MKKFSGLYAITLDDALLPRLSALVNAALKVAYRSFNTVTKPPRGRYVARKPPSYCASVVPPGPSSLSMTISGWQSRLAPMARISAMMMRLAARSLPRATHSDRNVFLASRATTILTMRKKPPPQALIIWPFGSVFTSRTKPSATHAPLALLTEAKQRFNLPIAAIGGITLDNAPAVLAAGADLLAVASNLFDVMDIQSRAEAYGALFRPAATPSTPQPLV
jgi:thiamine-phosphate pyrophosphorylase